MAQVKVVAKKAVAPVTVAKKAVATVKPVADGFKVFSIDSIEFLPSARGGGKPMDPATAKLIQAALTLKIGQGFKIPATLRINRVINGKNGQSTLYTYKGAVSLSKKAASEGKRFRTRRDTAQNLWLFRVEPLQVEQTEEVAEEEVAEE